MPLSPFKERARIVVYFILVPLNGLIGLVILGGLAGYLFLGSLLGFSLASDEEVIDHFKNHRSEFEQLAALSNSSVTRGRIDVGFVDPFDEDEFDADFVKKVRRLLKATGVRQAIIAKDGRPAFLYDATGLSIGGRSKSIYYSLGPIPGRFAVFVVDTDRYHNYRRTRISRRSYTSYRKIEEHWYIEFDYED